LPGVGEKTLELLKEAGIKNISDVIEAGEEGLVKIKGIGEKKAQKLFAEAKKLA
jgi:Holliday junction resolvasome RuvABC DNA-binding subunit